MPINDRQIADTLINSGLVWGSLDDVCKVQSDNMMVSLLADIARELRRRRDEGLGGTRSVGWKDWRAKLIRAFERSLRRRFRSLSWSTTANVAVRCTVAVEYALIKDPFQQIGSAYRTSVERFLDRDDWQDAARLTKPLRASIEKAKQRQAAARSANKEGSP